MSGDGPHIIPLRVYFTIFAALMVFTALTVWVAFHDFGVFNIVIALGIAITKASLVILYFMHVRYSSSLVKIAAVAGFFWLLILLGFTMADVLSRGWIPTPVIHL
jgi:cytochrome c oxidase subunit 4